MARHLTAQLDAIKRKPLAMRGEGLARRGEGDRKPLADPDLPRLIGRAIERALKLANLEKKDAAWRMGYEDQSALSRWIAGVETPQFAKLFGILELRGPLVVALAELAEDVDVTTTISVRRRAS